MLPAYEATFSVALECDECVKDISSALEKLPAIQSTGRAAILRGSGRSNSAAVCILELPPTPLSSNGDSIPTPNLVRGLIRLIELSAPPPAQSNGASGANQDPVTLLDLTLTGMRPGTYVASLRKSGDISEGAKSMGNVFGGLQDSRNGELGKVKVNEEGRGELVGEINWPIWEAVGRGIVVQWEGGGESASKNNGREEVVVGVVARSAGVWENEKVVCGCSGKTVWEEREEMIGKGMV
ncbi:MAG: hypothetical protein Q9195_006924 [Heterodermia aff. obscurata]